MGFGLSATDGATFHKAVHVEPTCAFGGGCLTRFLMWVGAGFSVSP